MWKEACSCEVEDMKFSVTPRDKAWFCNAFLYDSEKGIERSANDAVWDLAGPMSLSRDPLCIIAAIPALRTRYWSAHTKKVCTELEGGVAEHLILGECIQDPLSNFVCGSLRTGVATAADGVTQLVVVTDAGQDLDDEMAFVLARALQAAQQIELAGVVATLAPARARARLLRGTLDKLGFEIVPVAIGTDGGFTKYSSAAFEKTSHSYIAPDDDTFNVTTGLELLVRLYESAPANGLELLAIASLKDVALFIRSYEVQMMSKSF